MDDEEYYRIMRRQNSHNANSRGPSAKSGRDGRDFSRWNVSHGREDAEMLGETEAEDCEGGGYAE